MKNNNRLIVSGLILKKAIKRLDITQETAAKMLGVSRQTVVTWIGKSELDNKTCQIVKEKLGIDLLDLLQDEPTKQSGMVKNIYQLDPHQQLIDILKKELEQRDRIIENIISDKDKIIERTEEALELWKEKAKEYEKKISANPSVHGTKIQPRSKLDQGA